MIGAIGQYAIGEHPIDLSTPDYFQELLKRPYFDIVYLIELEPYDASIQKTEDGFGCIRATPIGAIGFDYTGSTKHTISQTVDTSRVRLIAPRIQTTYQRQTTLSSSMLAYLTAISQGVLVLLGQSVY